MNKLKKFLFMTFLCAAIIIAAPMSKANADVRVTFTFAVGGAACGLYFFFYFVSGFKNDDFYDKNYPAALFDLSSEGLRVKVPTLRLSEDGFGGYVPSAEIIRVNF